MRLTLATKVFLSHLLGYASLGYVLYILVGTVSGLVGVFPMEKIAHALLEVE